MKNLNTENFTYRTVNEFAKKSMVKPNANPCKKTMWLLAMSLTLLTGNLFSQQAFSKQKNLPDIISKILTTKSFEEIATATGKNKVNLSDTTECLEVSGKFDGSVKEFNGIYTAKLILGNAVVETQILNIRKQFQFTLQKNRFYAIRVEKDGYIPKTVSFSTHVSDTVLNVKNYYAFTFETNLLSQEIQGHFEDDDIDFPVALIGYNKTCDCFDYNKEYTTSLIHRMVSSLFFGI